MLTAAFALESQEEEAARRATAGERIRIARDERLREARDLYDAVARSLDVIAVQAGTAMRLIDADPSGARRALARVSRLSSSSHAEIRRLLGLVGDDEVAGG